MLINRLSAVSAACAVAAIIGGLGPWATVYSGFGSVSIDGAIGGAGQEVAIVAAIAAVLLSLHAFMDVGWLGWLGGGCHAVNAYTAISKWLEFDEITQQVEAEQFAFITLGWGIPVVAIASLAGLATEIASHYGVAKVEEPNPYESTAATRTATFADHSSTPFATARNAFVVPPRTITFEPNAGKAGTTTRLRARGLPPSDRYNIWWYDERGLSHLWTKLGRSSDGGFEVELVIPDWETSGPRRVQVVALGGRFVDASFSVLGPSPSADELTDRTTEASSDHSPSTLSLKVHPNVGPPNTELAVQAEGFYFDDEPRIEWIDSAGRVHASRAKAVSTNQGFIGRLAVPSWETPGMRQIQMRTDDGRTATGDFEVTAMSPSFDTAVKSADTEAGCGGNRLGDLI